MYNLSFATFDGDEIPPYVIASHRWSDDEATYVDVLEKRHRSSVGFRKIKCFCDLSKQRNRHMKSSSSDTRVSRVEWIWIDTCCIDQRSSAEIAENITSMYRYYEQAEECYVYLSDVDEGQGLEWKEFRESEWFTRGWTLQELLAPCLVIFVNSSWTVLGHKCTNTRKGSFGRHYYVESGECLNPIIARITAINVNVISKDIDPKSCLPRTKVNWAVNRKTTKAEDLAYCLLGLLGVHMLPMYGEGLNAWSRLADEVQKKAGISSPRIDKISFVRSVDEGTTLNQSMPNSDTAMGSLVTAPSSYDSNITIMTRCKYVGLRTRSGASNRSKSSDRTSPYTRSTAPKDRDANYHSHRLAETWKEEFGRWEPRSRSPDNFNVPKAKLADSCHLDTTIDMSTGNTIEGMLL